MPLSEYERKMLEELEAQLADEDPSFADTLKPEPPAAVAPMRLSIRHLVLGLLIAVLGIAILVGGIALEIVLVGVLGELLFHQTLVIQLQVQVQHVLRTGKVATDFVDLQIDRSALGEDELVAHLLHCSGGAAVEGESEFASLREFTLQLGKFFLDTAIYLTQCTLFGQTLQVGFSHHRERVVHEAVFETLQEFIFNNMD